MSGDEARARKFLETLPPDGHLCVGVPAWGAEAVVQAFLAGAEDVRNEGVQAKAVVTRIKGSAKSEY